MKHLILILSVFFSVSAMAQYTLPPISTHYHAAGIEGTRSLVRTYNDSVMIIYNQTAIRTNDNQFLALTNRSTSAIVMDIPADYEVAEMEIVGQWCFFGGKQYCGFSQNSLQTICHGYIGKFYIPDFLAGSGTVEFYTLTDVYEVTRLTAFNAGGEDRWGILAIAKETKTSSHRVLVELLNYVLPGGQWTCKIGTTTDSREYFQDVSAHGSDVFVISSILPQDIDPAVNYPDTILYVRSAKKEMILDRYGSGLYRRTRINVSPLTAHINLPIKATMIPTYYNHSAILLSCGDMEGDRGIGILHLDESSFTVDFAQEVLSTNGNWTLDDVAFIERDTTCLFLGPLPLYSTNGMFSLARLHQVSTPLTYPGYALGYHNEVIQSLTNLGQSDIATVGYTAEKKLTYTVIMKSYIPNPQNRCYDRAFGVKYLTKEIEFPFTEDMKINNNPSLGEWNSRSYETRRTLIKKDCQIEFNRGTVLSEEETE